MKEFNLRQMVTTVSIALNEPAASSIAVIDGQPVNLATQQDLIARVRNRAKAGLGFSLFTLNLDHLVKRRADIRFREAYSRATFVTADGEPVVALARRQGAVLERTTGADLILPLCELAEKEGFSLYFFGSSPGQLEGAAASLNQRYTNLKIVGYEAPPFGFDPASPAADAAADRIAASGANFCLVALGAPKQELFSDRMLERHPGVGFFCIGAALDFIAGGQKRAPLWMQKTGLEWVWRVLCHPRRMIGRYFGCGLLFLEIGWVEPLRKRLANFRLSNAGAK